ncbi:MAG: HAD family hydrolase [Phycisphaerales bacterium]
MPAPAARERRPRTTLAYDLIAIDLDGTLLGPDARVSERNVQAVHAARDAGLDVIVCTGRGYIESRRILNAIGQTDAVIVAGGSVTACGRTGATLHRFAMHHALVSRAVRVINESGSPAMVLKDAPAAGYDYLIVSGEDEHPLDPITSWWFDQAGATVRFVRTLDADEHPEQTLRVGLCTDEHLSAPIATRLQVEMGEATLMHNFPAVVGPHAGGGAPRRVNIVELFDARASKWSALSRLAEQRGITPSRIAAIGDEINDVCMIEKSGLGVAMGNAVPAVRGVADRHTLPNTEDGVAHAIDRILAGEW